MSIVFDDLHVRVLSSGRRFALSLAFVAYVGVDKYTVPAGFVTDFASVPRGLWNILPPFGRYSRAAVLHDWMYHTGIVNRARADRIFLEGMAALGVSWAKRWAMYFGVRVGGWVRWNQCRREKFEGGKRA